MEIRHLKYFATVAETLSFSEAAKILYRAQPAISQQIADLEEELGTELLKRTKRKVELTQAGRIFYKRVKEILANIEDAAETAYRTSQGEEGVLSIGFLGPAVFHFLPEAIKKFRKKFPKVNIKMYDMYPEVQHEALRSGKISVGFTRPFDKKKHSNTDSFVVYRDEFLVAMPNKHKLAKREDQLSLSDIIDEKFVIINRTIAPGFFELLKGILGKHERDIQIAFEANEVQTILTMVESECGIAILPGCMKNMRHTKVQFKPIETKANADLLMTWKKDEEDVLVHNFIEVVKELKTKNKNLKEFSCC